MVKKTRLGDYNSPRQAGVIAINFREDDDELIGAELVGSDDDILLVSRKGQAIRFRADDNQLRPMGRATGGVIGMKLRKDDEVIAAGIASLDADLLVVTENGYGKRTRVSEYPVKGRGGMGVKTVQLTAARGTRSSRLASS